jgi:hypothetical protein
MHWNQSGWTQLTDPALLGYDFADVWGTSASDIWLAGWYRVAHFDGISWTGEELPNNNFESITVVPSGHVWMAGDWGGILHRSP